MLTRDKATAVAQLQHDHYALQATAWRYTFLELQLVPCIDGMQCNTVVQSEQHVEGAGSITVLAHKVAVYCSRICLDSAAAAV